MSDVLVRERRGNVLVARLNRPEARNALNAAVLTGLGQAVEEAEADPEIRAIVLTGTGDRAFCAGMDLRSFASGEQGSVDRDAMESFHRLIQGTVTVPVVGAANATALAGGFELLLGCDVIVASSQAKFGLPEVKRGLFPAGNGTFLGTRIPLAIALEMALTGDSIDAARAYELGLVNQVVAPEDVLDAAVAFAERIAANGPLAVAATKELVRLAPVDFARAQQRVRELQPEVFASEDAKEGATAFVEKRAPVWRGR
jgi:enoyl-CoA hydratase/carnithine racemase